MFYRTCFSIKPLGLKQASLDQWRAGSCPSRPNQEPRWPVPRPVPRATNALFPSDTKAEAKKPHSVLRAQRVGEGAGTVITGRRGEKQNPKPNRFPDLSGGQSRMIPGFFTGSQHHRYSLTTVPQYPLLISCLPDYPAGEGDIRQPRSWSSGVSAPWMRSCQGARGR